MKRIIIACDSIERARCKAEDYFFNQVIERTNNKVKTKDAECKFINYKNSNATRGLRVDEIIVEENCPVGYYFQVLLPCLKPDGKVTLIQE